MSLPLLQWERERRHRRPTFIDVPKRERQTFERQMADLLTSVLSISFCLSSSFREISRVKRNLKKLLVIDFILGVERLCLQLVKLPTGHQNSRLSITEINWGSVKCRRATADRSCTKISFACIHATSSKFRFGLFANLTQFVFEYFFLYLKV